MGDTLVNIKADTIEEFCRNAVKQIREGKGEIGVTTYAISAKPVYDAKKIKKISFTLTTNVKRAHWSGGKADDRQSDAIKRAEELNRKHENRHREIAEDMCDDLFKDAVDDLVGKSSKDVDKAIADMRRAIDRAYDELDKREGMIEYMDDENKPAISVKLTGV